MSGFERALMLALLTRLDRQQVVAPVVTTAPKLVSVGPLAETSLRRYLAS